MRYSNRRILYFPLLLWLSLDLATEEFHNADVATTFQSGRGYLIKDRQRSSRSASSSKQRQQHRRQVM